MSGLATAKELADVVINEVFSGDTFGERIMMYTEDFREKLRAQRFSKLSIREQIRMFLEHSNEKQRGFTYIASFPNTDWQKLISQERLLNRAMSGEIV
jgi:hypothetical protein